jgi:hypothetical protein
LVKLDVLGTLVTLSEREADELRDVAAADAGRSTARRDLSLLLARGLRTKSTVALSRAELANWLSCFPPPVRARTSRSWREALLEALGDSQP